MTFMTGMERAERDWDSLQFRAIFAVCWPASLCAAASRRLSPHFWRSGTVHRSVLAEAREGAGTIARFALAG